MSTTTYAYIKTSEKKKFNGAQIGLQDFNIRFKARLKERNPLAAALLEVNVKIKEVQTRWGPTFETTTLILTHFLLALTVILAADPEAMRVQVNRKIYRQKLKPFSHQSFY